MPCIYYVKHCPDRRSDRTDSLTDKHCDSTGGLTAWSDSVTGRRYIKPPDLRWRCVSLSLQLLHYPDACEVNPTLETTHCPNIRTVCVRCVGACMQCLCTCVCVYIPQLVNNLKHYCSVGKALSFNSLFDLNGSSSGE